ncbi:hypothetical protein HKI87_04g32220 [Chloropicon roscoffensis]|uniref:Uncharacterized protein n=1 Tax=Chloropicon roscoffensis TaxID=1461544 RepID=A0AAX4P5P1_9CHLO
MRTDDAEDDEEIETLSTPPSGEQGPAEHAVQTRPDAGGRSLQSLLQSLVPARLQTTQNVPDSPSRHSDMIEEPTQTQGECEAAPDAGAPVLRSAQDDLVNALPVTGREWAYSSRGGGRGALVQRVQGLREELRRAAASSESGSGERVVVQSSSYECGFIKCWCALQDGGSAWVIFRGASCGELDTSKGSRLESEPPYHRREIDDTTVLLVRSARSILGSA